jgi:hypothetical protein
METLGTLISLASSSKGCIGAGDVGLELRSPRHAWRLERAYGDGTFREELFGAGRVRLRARIRPGLSLGRSDPPASMILDFNAQPRV